MKYKLLLIRDARFGIEQIYYREIIGRKRIKDVRTFEDKVATTFTRKVNLFDATTQTFRKQEVILRVITTHGEYLEVEVI